MTINEAQTELEKFVKLKTTMRPTFVDVLTASDLQHVKHARWERKGYHLLCPICGWRADPVATPYCPGCGANMKGDGQ